MDVTVWNQIHIPQMGKYGRISLQHSSNFAGTVTPKQRGALSAEALKVSLIPTLPSSLTRYKYYPDKAIIPCGFHTFQNSSKV